MRCSLLMLSTYLDGELNERRAAELDAHLVGCTRCQSGLGYLREESQRISGLARVHVPEDSAHALLVHVGLISADDILPGELPPPPAEHHDEHALPWQAGRPGKALPWSPPVRQAHVPPPPETARPSHSYAPVATLDRPPMTPHQPAPSAQLEVPGIAVPSAERAAAADTSIAEEAPIEVTPDIAAQPAEYAGAPQRATGSGAGAIGRMRDAIALRWALMRGGTMDEDSIDVITESASRMRAQAAEPVDVAPHAASLDEALHAVETEPVVDTVDTHDDFDIPFEPETPVAAPPAPTKPKPARKPHEGRHLRGIAQRHGATLPAWVERAQTRIGRGRIAVAADDAGLRDRRLWVFGAGTLLVMVVGLLIGKNVETPTAVAQRPVVSAHATPAVPRASVAPVTPATPSPTPAAGPNPAVLTGAQTLGSGARDYAVNDLRYGAHPGDYRIVFDFAAISGASPSGTPTATVGFGDATTLYVILASVIPSGEPAVPPAGLVRSITLLPHSPIAGHIVYQVTLTKAATLATNYLTGPTRLVIDLH